MAPFTGSGLRQRILSTDPSWAYGWQVRDLDKTAYRSPLRENGSWGDWVHCELLRGMAGHYGWLGGTKGAGGNWVEAQEEAGPQPSA